jgi:hypothetical protein
MRASLFQASLTHWTRCWGPTFSATELRPKKPVPIVMVGARLVSNPEAPRLEPALTTMRSTFISEPKRNMMPASSA